MSYPAQFSRERTPSQSGRGYVTVLRTDALQARLDRARGELFSDTRTLIFHLKIIRGKIGEIWRSEIANHRRPEAISNNKP